MIFEVIRNGPPELPMDKESPRNLVLVLGILCLYVCRRIQMKEQILRNEELLEHEWLKDVECTAMDSDDDENESETEMD